jgi:hypothetical protein
VKNNPWAEWLTHFRTPAGPALKKRSDFHHYMRLDQYKEKVVEWFEAKKGNAPAAEHMNLHAQAARELLALETPEVQQQMKAEAEALHTAALNKREDALEGLPALDEDDLEE